MIYNEFGDLVEAEDVTRNINSEEMSITPMLRLININWHHQVSLASLRVSLVSKGSHPLYPRLLTRTPILYAL